MIVIIHFLVDILVLWIISCVGFDVLVMRMHYFHNIFLGILRRKYFSSFTFLVFSLLSSYCFYCKKNNIWFRYYYNLQYSFQQVRVHIGGLPPDDHNGSIRSQQDFICSSGKLALDSVVEFMYIKLKIEYMNELDALNTHSLSVVCA